MQRSEVTLTVSQCKELLHRALGSEKVTLLGFELRPLAENVGFMGEHGTLLVRYREEERENQRSFFVKHTPRSSGHRDFVLGAGLFAKEREMYQVLLPLLATSLGIERLPVPCCHLVEEDEFLVLEDLSSSGFHLHDKQRPLDLEHCRAVLSALAKLHAGSIAVEAKEEGSVSALAQHGHEVLLVGRGEGLAGKWHEASLHTILGAMRGLARYRQRLEGRWEQLAQRMGHAWDECSRLAKPSTRFRNVLCHGDLWANNVLFKEDDEGCSAVLVDFQLYRVAPPILDVLMFLHLTTTRLLRERHLLELLLHYHAERHGLLRAAKLNPDRLPGCGLDELLASAQEYRFFAVSVALRYMPTCLKRSEDMEAVKRRLAGETENHPPGEAGGEGVLEGHPPEKTGQGVGVVEKLFTQEGSARLVRELEACPTIRTRVLEAMDEMLDWLDL